MNQAELFPADPPAPTVEHGGYAPPAVQQYRGHEIPATYRCRPGGIIPVDLPFLPELLDLILDALEDGPVHWYDLCNRWPEKREVPDLSDHVRLLERVGLIEAEPVYIAGRPGDKDYQGFQYRYSLPEPGGSHAG